MIQALVIFLCSFCFAHLNGFLLNLKNNACPKLELYHVYPFSSSCYVNPDVLSDVPHMAERHGYGTETHSVTTDDGYILNIFKILPKGNKTKENAIFIQHGIATNSGPWVDIGNRSIGFYLADRGYTVWLGNVRGSTYSNKHVYLTVNDPDYWNFTLDTIAERDMTTQVKYVFEQTNQKIHYIGHSMGTSVCLMLSSTFTEQVDEWLKSITLLAPVAYLNNVPVIEVLKTPTLALLDILDILHIRGLLYQETAIHNFLTRACKLVPELCYNFINIAFGRTVQFASDDLLLYYSYWPSGLSIYELKQYLQIANSKKFQKFDYGRSKNLKFYGTKKPPVYNLTKITLPIALLYGENDILYRKENLDRLFNELGSSTKYKYAIPADGSPQSFDHIDFLYSEYIVERLYKILVKMLEEFEK